MKNWKALVEAAEEAIHFEEPLDPLSFAKQFNIDVELARKIIDFARPRVREISPREYSEIHCDAYRRVMDGNFDEWDLSVRWNISMENARHIMWVEKRNST